MRQITNSYAARLGLMLTLSLGILGCADASQPTPFAPEFVPPTNAHLSTSPWPIVHHDSYAQHFSTLPGVRGDGASRVRKVTLAGLPLVVLFDRNGDILTVSKHLLGITLWKLDGETLEPLARLDFPPTSSLGGVYAFLDADERIVLGIGQRIARYRVEADSFSVVAEMDLGDTVGEEDSLTAVTALYSGELAFTTFEGVVGVVSADLESVLSTVSLEADVFNGISVDESGGIFAVTADAMHGLFWDGDELTERWSSPVEGAFATRRPGRLGTGSGTTPVLMGEEHVVLVDDAESMNLLVLERGAASGGRQVCHVQVFEGEAATENAVAVVDRSMIVEQNVPGRAGVARFDLRDDGTCEKVWEAEVVAPSCVPTISTASGLVYVYTLEGDEWALTGLDFETGRVVFEISTGAGVDFDGFFSALTIGPNGRIYLGVITGLLVIEDAP